MKQSRNNYLEALGIPDFLYSKIYSDKETSTSSNIILVEFNSEISFCEPGECQDLLIKMIASIELNLGNVDLISIEKSMVDEFIMSNSSKVILVMDSSFGSNEPIYFSTHHPKDILKNSKLKRESWEVLKKIKQCLK